MLRSTRRQTLSQLTIGGLALVASSQEAATAQAAATYRVRRLLDRPILAPGMDARMGANIEGPSLIRAPDWLPGRLGRYYLYFADHKGDYIRLAYADRLPGPWKVHAPGSLQLAQSGFPTRPPPLPADSEAKLAAVGRANRAPAGTPGIPSPLDDATLPHIASPDVHVDAANLQIVMYYHGLEAFGVQRSRVATSTNGIDFVTQGGVVGAPYMRVVRHGGYHYAMAMPGLMSRSRDGLSNFEPGPQLFAPDQRHSALRKRGDRLEVFWTRVGDAPERIYLSTIDLRPDWMAWAASEPVEVLRPERSWEGAALPIVPSYRSAVNYAVNQLRDPAVFQEEGRTYLVYAVKGEGGLAIAELLD